MISYRKILSQAFTTVKLNRFLWWYGLLLFLGTFLNALYLVASDDTIGQNARLNLSAFREWANTPWVMTVLSILLVLWFLLYFRARAGVILSIKMIKDKESPSFLSTFGPGGNFVGRLLGLSVFLQVMTLILSLLISTPISYLFSIGETGKATVLLVFGAMAAVPAAFLIFSIDTLAPIFLVQFSLPVRAAVLATSSLVSLAWRKILGFSLILVAVSLVTLIVAGIITAPFVIFAILSYHNGGSMLIWGPMTLISSIVFLSFGSGFMAFQQTAWVLFFGEIVKPQKFEEGASAEASPIV